MRAVIAIPSEPVRKAGGKTLHFKSGSSCAMFFQIARPTLARLLKTNVKAKPFCGYFFDYED